MAGAEISRPIDQVAKGVPAAVGDNLNAFRLGATTDSTTAPAKSPIDSTGAINFPSLSALDSSLTKAANASATSAAGQVETFSDGNGGFEQVVTTGDPNVAVRIR